MKPCLQLLTAISWYLVRFCAHTLWDIRLKTSLSWRFYLHWTLRAGDIRVSTRVDAHVDNFISNERFEKEALKWSNSFQNNFVTAQLRRNNTAEYFFFWPTVLIVRFFFLQSTIQMGPLPRKYWIEEMVLRQYIVYKLLLKNQNQSKTRLLVLSGPIKFHIKANVWHYPTKKYQAME